MHKTCVSNFIDSKFIRFRGPVKNSDFRHVETVSTTFSILVKTYPGCVVQCMSCNVLGVLCNDPGVLRNDPGVLRNVPSMLAISWMCCAMSSVLRNFLGLLRNDLGVAKCP